MLDTDKRLFEPIIGLALGLLIIFLISNIKILPWISTALLFGVILKLSFLAHLGYVLHKIITLLGSSLVKIILGIVYMVIVTPYGILFKLAHRKQRAEFIGTQTKNSSFHKIKKDYDKSFFEKTW